MFARFHGGARHREMQRVRGADMNGVDGRIGQQLAVIPGGALHSQFVGELPRLLRARSRDTRHFHVAEAPHALGVDTSHKTCAEDYSLQFFHDLIPPQFALWKMTDRCKKVRPPPMRTTNLSHSCSRIKPAAAVKAL